jgi:transcriptional regulator with XRE-family HTH domain
MPTEQRPPTVARRLLRLRLRRARRELGKTQHEVAEVLDWSPSKVLRIENGASAVSVSDLLALLTQYGNLHNERDDLLLLARESKSPPVVSNYGDVLTPQFSVWLDHEAYASRIRQFEPIIVPGILQTDEYAEAVVRGLLDPDDERDPTRITAARRNRIKALVGPSGPPMEFIIDETALRRAVGNEDGRRGYSVILDQIRHLKRLNTRGRALLDDPIEPDVNLNISIQVVPHDAGAYRCMRGPFEIIEFQGQEDEFMMYCESSDDDTVIRESQEEIEKNLIEKNGGMFDILRRVLPGPDRTNQLLDQIIAEVQARDAGQAAAARGS